MPVPHRIRPASRALPSPGSAALALSRPVAWSVPCLALGLALGAARPARAVPAFAFDAHTASTAQGRTVRAATAVGVLAGGLGDVSLALTRLDDSIDGPAFVVGAGTGLGLGSLLTLRAGIARADWDHAPDAWTVTAGPELHLAGTTLAARFQRSRFDGGRTVRGASCDVEHPVAPRWTGRLEASYAHGSDGTTARAFLGGARWNAVGPLQLIGEAGLAHDPYGVLGDSRGGDAGTPSLVGGLLHHGPDAPGPLAAPPASNALHPTALLGLRCILP